MFDRGFYSRDFLSLVAGNMFFWMSVNFFLPVLPIYYHTLGMSDHQIGLAVGAYSLGSVMFRVYSGRLVDRYGARPVLTAGVLLSVAAIGGYYAAVTLATAFLTRFLHGAGITGFSASALTTVTVMHDGHRTTEAVAFFTMGTMIGMGIASSTANWLYAAGGMPLVIAMGVATTVLALVLFPRRVEPKIAVVAAESLPLKKVVTVPPVYVATVSLFASNLCFGSIMTFLPLLMLSKGITESTCFTWPIRSPSSCPACGSDGCAPSCGRRS